ncbi:uncharacterized protein LOC126293735 isoform X1 [Schistocerca gregaria]|uniref:uncharacterized protein LOC126293735 isoform X1 n=1 Tax=Schistocerca gregaria TaxID=7010 RepID=UPI00211F0235|nr:uncharacterized protein LOC126293735 isoform X1 [Schistocerca gregaria]XP_049843025.1 uncharacterized protein LOC126293735 isoform X1 [Schistocerca gregaria]
MELARKDHIVMTPKCKTTDSTTLAIERRAVPLDDTKNDKIHVAGGDHQGIIINKELAKDVDDSPAQLSLEFRVFLVNAQTGSHTRESRTLHYWFAEELPAAERPSVAQLFFRELVSPQEFPRDYVGFIKKVMKLLQHGFTGIRKVEVTLKQLGTSDQPPPSARPSQDGVLVISLGPTTRPVPVSADESTLGAVAPLTEERIKELLESSFPNPVTAVELARSNGWSEEEVQAQLSQLTEKGIAKALEHGAYTRAVATKVQVVRNMPAMVQSKQPTIAIITAQYCEKLAVDSMLDNRETFVRYTTVGTLAKDPVTGKSVSFKRFGESNVYTLGNIGAHRIVCTKLPTVGHTREAITAAGNTTTRMLGTFQKVDHVFLVGVGGGVPHYTDYRRHVRLGDVVVSHPVDGKRSVYVYCENAALSESGGAEFEIKEYCPNNMGLQKIAAQLQAEAESRDEPPWMQLMREAINSLQSESEHNFSQPPADSDKLYMAIGERDLIEVAHPSPQEGAENHRRKGCPWLHLSPVASGRGVARDEALRQQLAHETGALAFDSEFDAVLDAVTGSCRDSFLVARGIADYRDGGRPGAAGSQWQPYAALAAAAVVRCIVERVPAVCD